MKHWPKNKKVFLHSEALCSEVASVAITETSCATGSFLWVAVQFRELHQFIVLKRIIVTRLLPYARRVDHQTLLAEAKTLVRKCCHLNIFLLKCHQIANSVEKKIKINCAHSQSHIIQAICFESADIQMTPHSLSLSGEVYELILCYYTTWVTVSLYAKLQLF